MNIAVLTALLGSGARLLNTASSLAVLIGAIYLVDCRTAARGADAIDRCYFTALPIMGIGAAGKGGYLAGYHTYNPALRQRSDKDRDS
jgi:hypothetical protein